MFIAQSDGSETRVVATDDLFRDANIFLNDNALRCAGVKIELMATVGPR